MWILSAVFSAFFAGITAVLAKCGIRKTDSDVVTALRTMVVLLFSWIMVFLVGSQNTMFQISWHSLFFLILSGLATGASWLCYFRALSLGDVNKVAPIDKSSTVLSVLLAMICFSETDHLLIKSAGILLLTAGIFLMVEKKHDSSAARSGSRWFFYAVGSAVFASLTSILAKVGVTGIESNLATAIRTIVVLAMAWAFVFAKGKQTQIRTVEKSELIFIVLSGLATGASWLCYYYAIQNGTVSVVVPIDKMSILVTIVCSRLLLKEKISRKAGIGLILMLAGTLVMTVWG